MTKIIQPLRIYTAAAERLETKHAAINYNLIVPLLCDNTHIPSFCITKAKTGTSQPLVTSCVAVHKLHGYRTELISHLDFSFGWDNPTAPTKQYIYHAGESAIPGMRHGVYSLEIVVDGVTYYSDYYKVGVYNQTIKLEFQNSTSFGDLWLLWPYSATYIAYTYDAGEFDEYSESYKDDDAIEVFSYNRFNKLRSFFIVGDSNVLDCLKLAQLCDEIYLTDEVSRQERIKIFQVTSEPVKRSNYIVVSVKYGVISDDVITVNTNTITGMYDQAAGAVVPVDGGLTFDGEDVYFDGELLTP